MAKERDYRISFPATMYFSITAKTKLQAIKEFPPELEYRLIYENPVWADEQRLKFEELQKKQSEEVAARKAKKEAEELERKEAAARETERRERALLAELKSKYDNA